MSGIPSCRFVRDSIMFFPVLLPFLQGCVSSSEKEIELVASKEQSAHLKLEKNVKFEIPYSMEVIQGAAPKTRADFHFSELPQEGEERHCTYRWRAHHFQAASSTAEKKRRESLLFLSKCSHGLSERSLVSAVQLRLQIHAADPLVKVRMVLTPEETTAPPPASPPAEVVSEVFVEHCLNGNSPTAQNIREQIAQPRGGCREADEDISRRESMDVNRPVETVVRKKARYDEKSCELSKASTKRTLGVDAISCEISFEELGEKLIERNFSEIFKNFHYTHLTHFSCRKCQISSLDGIENLPNLTFLDLSDNQIVDLSPLKRLEHLAHLTISRNLVSDLSPLLEIPTLKSVSALSNPIPGAQIGLFVDKIELITGK